jgi:LysM repeat protein
MSLSYARPPSKAGNVQGETFRPAPRLLQRLCACGGSAGFDGNCSGCRTGQLQCSAHGAARSDAPVSVHEALASPGQTLEPGLWRLAESRLGHDFSRVRVHADATAARSARDVNARAYTVGRDIVFGAGQYAPGSAAGLRVLTHELTHVIQQGNRQAPSGSPIAIEPAGGRHEAEAGRVERGTHGGAAAGSVAAPSVHRYEAGEHAEIGESGTELKTLAIPMAYPAQPGDTVASVAAKFGVPEQEIRDANKDSIVTTKAKDGTPTEGFNLKTYVVIPLTPATRDAAKTTDELKFVIPGKKLPDGTTDKDVTLSYGEGIALGDFYQSPDEMLKAPESELRALARLIQEEKKTGKLTSTADWQKATNNRYLK